MGFDDKFLTCVQGIDHLCRLEGGLGEKEGGGKGRGEDREGEGKEMGRERGRGEEGEGRTGEGEGDRDGEGRTGEGEREGTRRGRGGERQNKLVHTTQHVRAMYVWLGLCINKPSSSRWTQRGAGHTRREAHQLQVHNTTNKAVLSRHS